MTDDKRPFSWTVLMGDGLLLLCALLGFTGSFLSLYGDPDASLRTATALDRCAANGDLLLICAVLFGLTTLAVWSLPRSRNAAAGGLTALWAVVVWWNWTGVVQGAGIVVRDITALFASRVNWGQVFPYETGLLPGQEADAVQLFLLLVLAGLALLSQPAQLTGPTVDQFPELLHGPDGPVFRVHITPEGGDGDGG